jgi:hypothetical protein
VDLRWAVVVRVGAVHERPHEPPALVVERDQHLSHNEPAGEGDGPVLAVEPSVRDEPRREPPVERT